MNGEARPVEAFKCVLHRQPITVVDDDPTRPTVVIGRMVHIVEKPAGAGICQAVPIPLKPSRICAQMGSINTFVRFLDHDQAVAMMIAYVRHTGPHDFTMRSGRRIPLRTENGCTGFIATLGVGVVADPCDDLSRKIDGHAIHHTGRYVVVACIHRVVGCQYGGVQASHLHLRA